MGYPAEINGVSRAISDNVFTFSCPVTQFGVVHIGARMTLIKTSNSTFTIYSAAPYQPAVVNSLNTLLRDLGHLKSDESFVDKVTSIVIPNIQHTIAISGWHNALIEKGVKPSIIGPHKCFESVKDIVNCKIPANEGYKSLSGSDLVKFGLDPNDSLVKTNDFNFMYFPEYKNLEIVMFDKNSKAIMEGDIYFNFQNSIAKNRFSTIFNEQFGGVDPNAGVSGWIVSRMLADGSFFLKFFGKSMMKNPEAIKTGIELMVNQWKFEKIIPCHGDTIDSNGASEFRKKFLT